MTNTVPSGSARVGRGSLSLPWASALVFLSSAAALVLEIVGLRLVGPYVGVTLQTSSAVIGVALASIAFGTWCGGRLADRLDPRRLLGPALLLAAVTTALVVPVVRFVGETLRGSDPINVLLLALLALFVPVALLAAVTPLVITSQLADLRLTGQVVGRLSSVGTLGGITATFGTGFVLVAALRTSTIVFSLAVLLGAVGLFVFGWFADETLSGRRRSALVVGWLVATGITAVTPTPCDIETAYHCVRVVRDPDRADGRELWLNSGPHSYVDLRDPNYLKFGYVQWIAAVGTWTAPADVLYLGGGGFTLPRYFAGGVRDQVVLELDDELVELDRSALGLRTGPALRVVTGDARVGLRARSSNSRDLVVGDAFGHQVVPWHLTTREMVADVRRVLRDDGVYAMNVIDGPALEFVRAETATVAAVFRHVLVIARAESLDGPRGHSNFVIVASDRELPVDELTARVGAVAEPAVARDGRAFAGNASVLTDDYAPVDQLVR